MKAGKLFALLMVTVLVTLQAGCQSTCSQKCCQPAGDKKGFVSLFDGKTLNGWVGYKENGDVVPLENTGFEVADGMLHCTGDGKAYWLATKESFGDFTLRMEIKLTKGANSGIFVRVPAGDMPAHKGYEIQVLETNGEAPTSTSGGAIYDVLTPMRNMVSKPGEWNQVEVTCCGKHTMVTWNGFTVINVDLGQLKEPVGQWKMAYTDKPLKGILGVQNHRNELWFRNIKIKKY